MYLMSRLHEAKKTKYINSHHSSSMNCEYKQYGSCSRLKCEKVGEQLAGKKTVQSTFKLMMNNRKEIDGQDRLPAHIESPGTNKDNLFNDLITLFDEKNRFIWHDGGRTLGKNGIYSLCDTLWYIDGHHQP